MTHKTHARKGINTVRCGQRSARNVTFDPKKVTCKTCLRLMEGAVK
jgi:hypothetical protein